METKLIVSEMQAIKTELVFPSMLVVPSVRCSGGLVLLWKNEVVVFTQTYSLNHIDVHVSSLLYVPWRLTGVYGHPEARLKSKTWRLMSHLQGRALLLWVCLGDFNKIFAYTRGMVESPNCYGPCRTSKPHYFCAGLWIWVFKGIDTHGETGDVGRILWNKGLIGFVHWRNGESFTPRQRSFTR